MNKKWDALWINGTLATCEQGYGLIKNAAIAVKDGSIAWLGKLDELSESPENLADNRYDLQGKCLTPGFIDCHTHLIYAGNRAHEFEMRLKGASYEEIAREGGGIQSTVTATRAASEDVLLAESLKRASALINSGVTTFEVKSGYGLDWETEKKILKVADKLQSALSIDIHKTFLGAHTVPKEYHNNVDAYVDYVCNEMIPAVASEKLASAVDVFCEKIAFSLEQTERIFQAARRLDLAVKCHAEQLSDSGSAALAAHYQALSVDHLEYISKQGIDALAASGTVAVLLPGAFYFLRETKLPPVNQLREKNIPIAIATDCNPGTSPVTSLLLILNMACTLFRLTPEEALLAVTKHAAKALGIAHSHGTLAPGKAADFAVWDISHPAELAYNIAANPLDSLVKRGNALEVGAYR